MAYLGFLEDEITKSGLSAKYISWCLGVSVPTFNKMRNGSRPLRLNDIKMLMIIFRWNSEDVSRIFTS